MAKVRKFIFGGTYKSPVTLGGFNNWIMPAWLRG